VTQEKKMKERQPADGKGEGGGGGAKSYDSEKAWFILFIQYSLFGTSYFAILTTYCRRNR
jgi:hypothetical protein